MKENTQIDGQGALERRDLPFGLGVVACIVVLATVAGGAWLGAGCSEGIAPVGASPALATADDYETQLDALFSHYPSSIDSLQYRDTTGAATWLRTTLAGMTTKEKIGQLFVVNHGSRNIGERLRPGVVRAVREHHVGGFLISRLLPPEQVALEFTRLQRLARIPLFVAADYERGVGRYSNHFTELPSNMAIGATRDSLYAGAAGRLTAIESRAIGVNLLLAPVVDVNNNPDNPIINIRSYGDEAEMVATMSATFVREAQRFGLLTTLKHFPGHGNSAVDTHSLMGRIQQSRNRMDEVELHPFRYVASAVKQGPAAVMTSHLWSEAFDSAPTPASFSRSLIEGYLRGELSFDGLVMTDDIRMGALASEYSLATRVVTPIVAGADVIVTPEDLPSAILAVEEAMRAGVLSEQRIDDSVRRILRAKARAGLHNRRTRDAALLTELLQRPYGRQIAREIAFRAVSVFAGEGFLPRPRSETAALVQISNFVGSESIGAAMDSLSSELSDFNVVYETRTDRAPAAEDVDEMVAIAGGADEIVMALHLRLTAGRGDAGLEIGHLDLARRIIASGPPVTVMVFGNPYVAAAFPEAQVILVAYDQTIASVQAASAVLRGTLEPRGRLPETLLGSR